jgi:polyisoprenoid-binding protein YceI
MKNFGLKTGLVFILAITLVSFTAITSKKVNVNDSKIIWKGYKVTGEHEGTIMLKEGQLEFDGTTLVGGNFVMDMTTINTTDIQGEWKDKLDGHLKSDDFFGVNTYKTATLKFTKVQPNKEGYNITGDLTIKGITKSINFTMKTSSNNATAALKIDRTAYGIKYKSASFIENLKDKAIYDEFDLNVNLFF